ncbi:MAG: AAA family ATPase, partial [Saprospiraceae bacterium]|nr:AAA family ATPase [Saprospiraceae bacterium]
PFILLSEGYRNTLGLIADIAYRMAELNPHVTTDTPGVVLIDEIDLHLHPKWQRNIVGDLKRIFPNCQFIVTTHSPFIIQSLDVDDGIIRLDNEYEEVPEDFVNQSIEDIVENMQGVENPQWSEKKTAMYEAAQQYFKTLEKLTVGEDDAQIQKLREELELISKPYASNVAYLAFLEQKRLVREAQLTKGQQVVNDSEQQANYKKTRKS